MEMVRVRYISDKPSVYFRKGGIYEAYRAKDDRRGFFGASILKMMMIQEIMVFQRNYLKLFQMAK